MAIFGRDAKTEEEKETLQRCYKEGMRNGWASGRYAMQDGDFITEEDRLNPNSICFIDNEEELEQFFESGNWCLGTGIVYKNLFFLNQIDGGDEWATYKIKKDKVFQFESITFIPIIERGGFKDYLHRLETADDEQLINLEYQK